MAKIPRVLIVDDDVIIASLIILMLEKKGYTVAGKTGSGEDSIWKAAELEPDLILMNINLNWRIDGVTAARYLFQHFLLFPAYFLPICVMRIFLNGPRMYSRTGIFQNLFRIVN